MYRKLFAIINFYGGIVVKVAIIDIRGAGIGQSFIKKIRKEINDDVYIIALGMNTCAASNMVRAGANIGISGEKAICSFCTLKKIDSIIVPIGVLFNWSITTEVSPLIAKSIFEMDCIKYILPLQNHGIYIPGTRNLVIKDILTEIIFDIKKRI